MNLIRKSISVILCLLLVLFSFAGCSKFIQSSDIVILFSSGAMGENAANASYAALSQYKNQIGKKYNLSALVDTGSAIANSSFDVELNGEYAAKVMQQVGYDIINLNESDLAIDNNAVENVLDLIGTKVISSATDKSSALLNFSGKSVAFVSVPSDISANASIKSLEDEIAALGADYSILITAFSIETASDLAAKLSGVSAILSSSSESVSQKILKDKNGDDVIFASCGTDLKYIGQLTITFGGTLTTTLVESNEIDEDIASLEKSLKDEYDSKLNTTVATLSNAVSATRDETIVTIANRETQIGDLVADAFKKATGADIALVAASEIASGLPEGEISQKVINECLIQNSEIVTMTLTGAEIGSLLELACQNTSGHYSEDGQPYGTSDNFLQISGLRYVINTNVGTAVTTDENGKFVSVSDTRKAMQIRSIVDGEESEVLVDKTYTVAVSRHMIETNPILMTKQAEDTTGEITDRVALLNLINELNGDVSEYEQSARRITIY